MNICELRKKIKEKNMSVEKIAQSIGVDRSTMYRKIAALEKITIGEAKKITKILRLTNEEAISIFFS